ncbi:MAG: DUF2442 domain-containing protein [Ignavibacteriae bacterium]|nr:DUF2442 domain-containing protein [Ignavibacteriota bacterium]
MTTLTLDHEPNIKNFQIHNNNFIVELDDERAINVPLSWYPRLQNGTTEELNNWELCGGGYGIHWEQLDEDISIQGILAGLKSAECEASFEKWLAKRKQ